jgi:outer membrane protein OmpA-like peptidoglycan-associated protein
MFKLSKLKKYYLGVTGMYLAIITVPNMAIANPNPLAPTPPKDQQFPAVKVIVNSNSDGEVIADEVVTLREAILIVNGSLPIDQLSEQEKKQVQEVEPGKNSRIQFNLPSQQTTIKLKTILPPLANPGLVVDGTSQPGYDANKSATNEIKIAVPIVAITAEEGQEILRGLTVISDRITIKGLSLYGFNSKFDRTLTTPPADIFISHRLPPPETIEQPKFGQNSPFTGQQLPPKDVIIRDNWLGITPQEETPETQSAFGVSVFNGINTTIYRNRIANHEGSGIITSVTAENMKVAENIIVGNGVAGMPDAVRLEGIITDSLITGNLICGNDGSGIYLFKPQGSITVKNNNIKFNGKRLRRSAIYLMGNDHKIIDNYISNQVGSGVAIAAYPQSIRNIIQANKFNALEGLSIDLNTANNVEVQDFSYGDGINPPRNSGNRKLDTGNAAINRPEFMSDDFFVLNYKVNLDGKAEPNSQIDIYKVSQGIPNYGSLNQYIASTKTDDKGKFSITLENLKVGDKISAIATNSDYGTSEPSSNVTIKSLDNSANTDVTEVVAEIPQCTSKPPTDTPDNPNIPENPNSKEIPPVIKLKVPTNVHFALDKYNISEESAKVLDEVVKILKEYPTIIIDLQGHTDYRANVQYNQRLGMNRSRSVRKYLLKKGIAPERMNIRSFGEGKLKEPGSEKIDHARNRRVEIIYKNHTGIAIETQEDDLQLEKMLRGK